MAGPLNALIYAHNAIRKELDDFQNAIEVLDVRNPTQVGDLVNRFNDFNGYLHDHEQGEEIAVFPAISERVPGFGASYVADHRKNDAHLAKIKEHIHGIASPTRGISPPLVARHLQTEVAAFRADMIAHLQKEEQQLMPAVEQHFTMPEIGAMVGKVSASIPQERMGPALSFMMRRLSTDDRIAMLRAVKAGAPAPAFHGMVGIVSNAIGRSAWADVTQKAPDLIAP